MGGTNTNTGPQLPIIFKSSTWLPTVLTLGIGTSKTIQWIINAPITSTVDSRRSISAVFMRVCLSLQPSDKDAQIIVIWGNKSDSLIAVWAMHWLGSNLLPNTWKSFSPILQGIKLVWTCDEQTYYYHGIGSNHHHYPGSKFCNGWCRILSQGKYFVLTLW